MAERIKPVQSSSVASLTGLTDVNITGPTNRQILEYNASAGTWDNADSTSSGTSSLDGLTDVTITGISSNQILKYSGTQWTNQYLGYYADSTDFSVNLGETVSASRKGEVYHKLDNTGDKSWSILGWFGSTDSTSSTEIFLDGSSDRCSVTADSVISFNMDIVCKGNTSGNVSMWNCRGAIKRDSVNNTAIAGSVSKTTIVSEISAADVDIEADDVNEALVIKVTGTDTETISWIVTARLSELVI